MNDGIRRLEERYGRPLEDTLRTMMAEAAQPPLALANLERWLAAVSNAQVQLDSIVASPALARVLGTLLGASQPMSDSLVQNPELASILFDPQAIGHLPSAEEIEREGRQLLSVATSSSHSRDRLRYLKQRTLVPIVAGDLLEIHSPAKIWRALSDLADGLIRLACDQGWAEFRRLKDLPEECPIAIIGFGKLGGQELNYSSDVDLVYVLLDEIDERVERECVRFCEAFGRSLSDRMGRGSLFRVDLRLRPYGGTGAILRRMASYEGYYVRYAEAWEIQALMRSRCVTGPPEIAVRWDEMVRTQCFRAHRSDMAVEELLRMRTRIEESAAPNDIKRGVGGIRDIEFLVQILQLIHGLDQENLQVRPTLDALDALRANGLLNEAAADALRDGYVLLRTVEHRLQLVGDNQTHSVPEVDERRRVIALLSGFESLERFDNAVARTRSDVHRLYLATLAPGAQKPSAKSRASGRLGALASKVTEWVDGLPGASAFYEALDENEGSLARVRRILEHAPALVSIFRDSIGLTEGVWSGEIEEAPSGASRFDDLPLDAPTARVAHLFRDECVRQTTRWVLDPSGPFPSNAGLMGSLLGYVHRRLGASFDMIALGSLALGVTVIGSDADLLLLVEEPSQQPEAEVAAQGLLRFSEDLRRLGSPIQIDLRLRPDGKRGLLVRSLEGLRTYDLHGMDMWERFALGMARDLVGQPANVRAVLKIAYGLPLNPERLQELTRMKRRIETERVYPSHVMRQVKLGYGGLSDIEWLVHLTEMRYPSATSPGTHFEIEARVRSLGQASLLNALECQQLLEAWRHLLECRLRLRLFWFPDDLIPENPDKLNQLAHSMGFADGNAFLAHHRIQREATRAIFLDTLERLRA